MIAIDRLHNRYQIAASGTARAQMVRRLDHVCTTLLTQALEAPARDFADPDGPVYKIRKLKLRLWLDLARRSDGQIAEDWARLLARALHRQIAEGTADTVMRYPSQAAFLAAWVLAVLDGTADGRWMYREFQLLHDLPAGRAIVAGLARHPDLIAPTLCIIAARGQGDRLVAALRLADITALWTVWTGAAPRRGDTLALPLLQSLPAALTPPAVERGSAEARARTALRWLILLTTPPASLTPQTAAPLAMQLAQLRALFDAAPELRQLWVQDIVPAADIRHALGSVPADLDGIAQWAARQIARADTAAARSALARLIPPAPGRARAQRSSQPDQPETAKPLRLLTPFAGAALLLPALRAIDPDQRFGADHRHRLLAAVYDGAQNRLATGDFGLRHLSGLPPEAVLDPVAPDGFDADLTRLLTQFQQGLRGMQTASRPFLTRQFFAAPGTLIVDQTELRVRIPSIPFKVLLILAGRLGDQGPLPWHDNRRLVIEVGDG